MSVATMVRRSGKLMTFTRQSVTKDASKAPVRTWPTVIATDQPVDVQPVSANTALQFAAMNMIVTHEIFMDADLGLKEGDRGEMSGRYFRIMGFYDVCESGRLWKATAEEQRGT